MEICIVTNIIGKLIKRWFQIYIQFLPAMFGIRKQRDRSLSFYAHLEKKTLTSFFSNTMHQGQKLKIDLKSVRTCFSTRPSWPSLDNSRRESDGRCTVSTACHKWISGVQKISKKFWEKISFRILRKCSFSVIFDSSKTSKFGHGAPRACICLSATLSNLFFCFSLSQCYFSMEHMHAQPHYLPYPL